MTQPDWPPAALWDFSVRIYSQPGVEATCLSLQDDHGFDVNLILFATWAAGTGRRLNGDHAAALRSFGDSYQASVMRPLRQARRALKSQVVTTSLAPLLNERRRALMGLELDLERLEQLHLAALVDPPASDLKAQAVELLTANLDALYPGQPVPDFALAVLGAALAGAASHDHVVSREKPTG